MSAFLLDPFPAGRVLGNFRGFELATQTREAAEELPGGIQKAGKWRVAMNQKLPGKGGGHLRETPEVIPAAGKPWETQVAESQQSVSPRWTTALSRYKLKPLFGKFI